MKKTLELTLIALNAALYAVVGLFTYFGIVVYNVRFWPAVIVPATFAILFGPYIGGVGAAIGIFISDILYGHHDALLSLLVGVPSNFLGFFIIGKLANYKSSYLRMIIASIVGLGVGSIIIGLGLWGYSNIFALPFSSPNAPSTGWTIYIGLISALWTFISEIPFLIFVVPPLVRILENTLPDMLVEGQNNE